MNTKLGQRLRTQRLQRGWTLAELGKHMSCSPSHLLRIEHGESLPSLPFLSRLLTHYPMNDTEIADLVRSATSPDGDPVAADEDPHSDDEGEPAPHQVAA